MFKRRLEQLSEENRPPLADRIFFWIFASLFLWGALKVEEKIEE